ncbi:hypothetical protein ACFVGY_34235 [Streptomyces sp. NPDC127106]|uniref:hypothetical protein n=1 Tax=Streptomyces sp. NPDC127106 TaxID=3345360 RepID=UPI0036252A79
MAKFAPPEPQEFVIAFGVEAAVTGDTQFTIDFSEVVDDCLEFSYDVLGGSVAVTWSPARTGPTFTIFREGATLLRIIDEYGSSKIMIDFSTDDTVGAMETQIFPHIVISDRTLLR